VTKQTETARPVRAVPGRRLVAAGIISRRVSVRITEAGVTGILRKGARR
jgi:hypothetical protein